MFITSGYIENNTWVRGNTRFISSDLFPFVGKSVAIPFVILTAIQAGTDRSSTSLYIRNKIFARLTCQVIHS
jgi:hypothetical protein